MKLLALIFAYAISHFISNPERFRQFDWFKSWSVWIDKKINISSNEIKVILIIAIPVFIISFVLVNIFHSTLGGLLLAIVVLSYCIGPKSLEEEVESGEIRTKLGVRSNAKIATLIKKMTQVSLARWFGIFFWYIVLGLLGALLYRLSERLDFFTNKNSDMKPVVDKLMSILNYPVAWLMVISLAVASDFERVLKKCKPYMNLLNMKSMDASFLYEAVDFAVENCEIEPDTKDSIEVVTISVLNRMLVVWLVIVSTLIILAV